MNNKMVKLINNFEKSFFNKRFYEIPVDPRYLNGTLWRWSLPLEEKNRFNEERNKINKTKLLEQIVPEFQRDNKKWSKDMKISFVENILLGASSTLSLYYVSDKNTKGTKTNCRLLDGLQRVSALADWLEGKFPIFDDIYFKDVEKENSYIWDSFHLNIRIYEFDDLKSAVRFYIQMNENITHSKEDILKAKKYLELLEKNEATTEMFMQ